MVQVCSSDAYVIGRTAPALTGQFALYLGIGRGPPNFESVPGAGCPQNLGDKIFPLTIVKAMYAQVAHNARANHLSDAVEGQ